MAVTYIDMIWARNCYLHSNQEFSKQLHLLHLFLGADIRLDHLTGWHWISVHIFHHISFSAWTWPRSSCCKVKTDTVLKCLEYNVNVAILNICIHGNLLERLCSFLYLYSFISFPNFYWEKIIHVGQCIYEEWWIIFSLDEYLWFQSSRLIMAVHLSFGFIEGLLRDDWEFLNCYWAI